MKPVQWRGGDHTPIHSYKDGDIQWHILQYETFYVFVAEAPTGGNIELMRVNPTQHSFLKNLELLSKNKPS